MIAPNYVRVFNKHLLNPLMLRLAGRKHWYASVIETPADARKSATQRRSWPNECRAAFSFPCPMAPAWTGCATSLRLGTPPSGLTADATQSCSPKSSPRQRPPRNFCSNGDAPTTRSVSKTIST